ncbi:MAG: hypothetical protein IJU81_01440 [Bacteroidales bacterium]|nr:hypothetical protein [Bacteroidales bacterium]
MTSTPTTDNLSPRQRWLPFAVKMLLGVVFAASAVAKMLSIDSFEIYVYSLGWFPLPAALILSRLVIAIELLLAIGLLSNLCARLTTISTLLALTGFSLFLAIVALSGRTDNCHCFGELVDINPVRSLAKNAILILMTLVAMRTRQWNWRPFPWLWPLVVAAPIATVFIVSPPDNWLFHTVDEPYNKPMFTRHVEEPDGLLHLAPSNSPRILAFYSPGCHFCRLAATKIGTMQQRHDIDSSLFVNIFPQAEPSRYDDFFAETLSPRYRQLNIPPDTFLHLTYGMFPLIMLMQGDSVHATYNYRTINEQEIIGFLSR